MVYKFFLSKLKKTMQKRGNKSRAEIIFWSVCKIIFELTNLHPFIVINKAIGNGLPLLLLRSDKTKKYQLVDKTVMPVFIKNENTRVMYSVKWLIEGAKINPAKTAFSLKLAKEILLVYYKDKKSYALKERAQLHKSALYYRSVLVKSKRILP